MQIFVAAAMLEYGGDGNDRVARNILEVGLESFIAVPQFVLQYADFLIGLADIHNARALFERALGQTPSADSKPLWDKFLQVRPSTKCMIILQITHPSPLFNQAFPSMF